MGDYVDFLGIKSYICKVKTVLNSPNLGKIFKIWLILRIDNY